jgi:hypothetical protein
MTYPGRIELIQQSIAIILDTEPGERIMLPSFGCGLRRYLMELNRCADGAEPMRCVMAKEITTAQDPGAAGSARQPCGDTRRGRFVGVDRYRLPAHGGPSAG